MPKLTRKVVILAKVEPTYNVDAVPTGELNAILVNEGVSVNPTGDKVSRDVIRNTFSKPGSRVGGIEVGVDITAEAKGGGWDTADPLAPEIEPLLIACGMKVDATVPGNRTFLVTSELTEQKSSTIYCHKDGILHIVTGCRGTWTLDMGVGKIPTFKFSLKGMWINPTDTPMPGTVNTSAIIPPICKAMNAMIDAYSPVGVNSLSIDLGAKVTRNNDINAAEGISGFTITDRACTGSIDPEVDALANFNPWTAWKASTPASIQCTVGSDQGNRFDVSVPGAVYNDPKYGDRDGISIYNLPFECSGTSDDEFSMTFR